MRSIPSAILHDLKDQLIGKGGIKEVTVRTDRPVSELECFGARCGFQIHVAKATLHVANGSMKKILIPLADPRYPEKVLAFIADVEQSHEHSQEDWDSYKTGYRERRGRGFV